MSPRRPAVVEPLPGLFLRRGALWWCRVESPISGETFQRSTGAPAADVQRANDTKLMLRTLVQQQQFDLVHAAAVGKIPLAQLYASYITNQLGAARAAVNDVDLSPLVTQWERFMEKSGRPGDKTRHDYVLEVRTLIPEDARVPASQLTEQRVDWWLAALAEQGLTSSTQRRYGAALKVFAKWLRKQGHMPTNPLRDWELPPNLPPRQFHWRWKTLRRVLACMPQGEPGSLAERERICVYLMAATGMELSAALRVAGGEGIDFERHMVFARGTKNQWRQRWVEVRSWFWPDFKRYAATFIHGALLFEDVNADTLRDHFYDAQVTAGVATKAYSAERRHTDYRVEHTIHDLRHTFCYLAFTGKDGDAKQDLHYCKRQLGHRNLTMSQLIYANFNLESGVDDEDDSDDLPLAEVGT